VRLKLLSVVLFTLMFAFAPMYGRFMVPFGESTTYATGPGDFSSTTGIRQADNDNDAAYDDADNDDADADNDNGAADDDADADNDDADADNDDADGDNNDTDGDNADANTNDNDDVAVAAPALVAPPEMVSSMPPGMVSGTSTGADVRIATSNDRVVVQVFSGMPAGITLKVSPADLSMMPAYSGHAVPSLAFRLEAQDAQGNPLVSLPAEVNLAVRYADVESAGMNESAATIALFDPSMNVWRVAPKVANSPDGNYVAASVTELGTYVVAFP
jgi:hypothetical protein